LKNGKYEIFEFFHILYYIGFPEYSHIFIFLKLNLSDFWGIFIVYIYRRYYFIFERIPDLAGILQLLSRRKILDFLLDFWRS
jgi:hypothetical protein